MFERLLKERSEAGEFDSAVLQTQSLIEICSDCAHYHAMKMKMLIKARRCKEAQEFSDKAVALFPNKKEVLEWRAKAQYFNGSEILATKTLNSAFDIDSEDLECQKLLKTIKKSNEMKEKASEFFKAGQFQEAVDKFNDCLDVNEDNQSFNAVILLNISIAMHKMGEKVQSRQSLDRCLKLKPDYTKALVKRGEIHLEEQNYDEAIDDLQMSNQLAPGEFGVESKLKRAKDLKKKNKKDYYQVLDVSKTATHDEIKKAYKKLAIKWHPDKNAQNEESRKKAEKQFQGINEAFAVIGDE